MKATIQPSAVIASRKSALRLMNKKLLAKLQQIESGMASARTNNLRWYYELGEVVRTIRDNNDEYAGTDGTNGLKLIEQALSTQARTLRRAATFRESFTAAEFERLIGLENTETKFQLHWGHINYLLTVEDHDDRWRFAVTACEKMLSPPELHAHMKRRLGRSRGHGRRHKVPETLRGQLTQVEQATTTWNTKQAQVWDGDDVNVMSNLMKASPDDVDQEFVDNLKTARAGFQEMAESAAKNVERFDRIIERCEKMLKTKQQQAVATAAAEANAGKRTRAIDIGSSPRRKAS
jgi:hypothetical protein